LLTDDESNIIKNDFLSLSDKMSKKLQTHNTQSVFDRQKIEKYIHCVTQKIKETCEAAIDVNR
jgi:hypothetical protein